MAVSAVSSSFKMEGFKFFQRSLDHLKEMIENSSRQPSKTIPSSALGALLGLHALCHEDGMLPSDFNYVQLAEKTGLDYDTVRKGFHWLVQKGWVAHVWVEGHKHVLIVGYAECNRSTLETPKKTEQDASSLSYFRVPTAIFTTGVLRRLVHHKDTAGLLVLLEFCNYFTRQLMYDKEKLSDYVCTRRMSYLKRALRRKAHQVREYITEVIRPLFEVDMHVVQERHPRSLPKRKRPPVTQVVVDCIRLTLTNVCAKVNDDFQIVREMVANFHKNVKHVLNHAGRKISKKDMLDIEQSFSQEVGVLLPHIDSEQHRKDLQKIVIDVVCRRIDKKVQEGERIDSVGAFVRHSIRIALNIWRSVDWTRDVAADTVVKYAQVHGEYPAFILREQTK